MRELLLFILGVYLQVRRIRTTFTEGIQTDQDVEARQLHTLQNGRQALQAQFGDLSIGTRLWTLLITTYKTIVACTVAILILFLHTTTAMPPPLLLLLDMLTRGLLKTC